MGKKQDRINELEEENYHLKEQVNQLAGLHKEHEMDRVALYENKIRKAKLLVAQDEAEKRHQP